MTTSNVEKGQPQALVIGAGIAGIKAALELAESGVRVHVCDVSPGIGGALFQIERWFPDDHCGLCKALPVFDRGLPSQYCLRRGLQHPNIEFHPGCEVAKLEGEAGHFTVSVRQNPRKIDPCLCTGCGLCSDACPVSRGQSKAVYLNNPQSLRKTYLIDNVSCNKCGRCVEACPVKAIDLNAGPEIFEVVAGAIILSTGFEELDPQAASQYGYRRYPNVITGFDLEHMLGGNSPSNGLVLRPSDCRAPGSIAFIQCVGSRDRKADYCSSTCCMCATREAGMIKEQNREARVEIFCMDLRSFGKGHQRYIDRAEKVYGIKFTRGRAPAINQDFRTHNLLLNSFNSAGKVIEESFDMVVLSASQRPSAGFGGLGKVLGIELNRWGFAATGSLSPVETSRRGIFACGSATGPRDISESVAASSAAAGMAMAILKPGIHLHPGQAAGKKGEGTGVYFCNCSGQVSRLVDLAELKAITSGLAGVKTVREFDRLCSEEQLSVIKESAAKEGVKAMVIAACSSLRPLESIGGAPVSYLNIREELTWPHADPVAVIDKGKKMLAMAIESSKWKMLEAAPGSEEEQRALVIGAGLAGLEAALSIAGRGFEVEVIEKVDSPGGHALHIYRDMQRCNIEEYLGGIIKEVTGNPCIHMHTGSEVINVTGYAGKFACTILKSTGDRTDLKAGAVVIATGAEEYKPASYGYGTSKSIVTQSELEDMIHSNDGRLSRSNSVVMIQCVESRDEQRQYCSRVCCGQALKNSLAIKERFPGMAVTVLYRDIMSYGFQEEFYTMAREKGVLFLRHDLEHSPAAASRGEQFDITVHDASLGRDINLTTDLLVLSTGIKAPGENKSVAAVLGIDFADDCFVREAELKFQPVDTSRDGIFVCGLANGPMNITESIVQARAAGHRAAALLAHGRLEPLQNISEVNERRCTGCGLCIAACPYNGRIRDENRRVTVVISELCRGCGACSAVCPNGAATLKELGSKQVFSMLDMAL